jgi:DNA-binding MarR family transcriptional regulator
VANDKEPALLLNQAAIRLLRGLHAVDQRSGLTTARLSALSVLVFAGPQTIGRLATAEQVAGPTITRIVDGLERLGLARREPHPDSARMTLVSATDAGTELMLAARQRRVDAISDALGRVTDADRSAIVAAADALARLPLALSRDE